MADGHVVRDPSIYWDIYSAVSSNNSPTPPSGCGWWSCCARTLQHTGIYILLLVLITPPPLHQAVADGLVVMDPAILGYIYCCRLELSYPHPWNARTIFSSYVQPKRIQNRDEWIQINKIFIYRRNKKNLAKSFWVSLSVLTWELFFPKFPHIRRIDCCISKLHNLLLTKKQTIIDGINIANFICKNNLFSFYFYFIIGSGS